MASTINTSHPNHQEPVAEHGSEAAFVSLERRPGVLLGFRAEGRFAPLDLLQKRRRPAGARVNWCEPGGRRLCRMQARVSFTPLGTATWSQTVRQWTHASWRRSLRVVGQSEASVSAAQPQTSGYEGIWSLSWARARRLSYERGGEVMKV